MMTNVLMLIGLQNIQQQWVNLCQQTKPMMESTITQQGYQYFFGLDINSS